MASEKALKDIDENFLQCSICLGQLKEPKSLPCLHRYCRDCLNILIKGQDKEIECPECREKYNVPEDGVDGFKTDFNTKNIVDFVQLRQSVKCERTRVCIGCTKTLKVTGYCFICKDFLCQGCHDYHMTNMTLQYHRPHTLDLSKIESLNLTLEQLSPLTVAPRCHTHLDKIAELCCTTCGSAPICIVCTYGAHEGHKLHDVASLAKVERKALDKKMAALMTYKENIYKMGKKMRLAKLKLNTVATERENKLQREFDEEEKKIKIAIKNNDEKMEDQKTKLRETLNMKSSTKKQLEKQIRILTEKYDKECEDENIKNKDEIDKLNKKHRKVNVQLVAKLRILNKGFQKLLTSVRTQVDKHSKNIDELSSHYENIMKRFENLTATTTSLLVAKNDWTDVQCMPDIRSAIDLLIQEAKKEFPQIESLFDVKVRSLSSIIGDRGVNVCITEHEESSIDVQGLNITGWAINDITGSDDGSVVITGRVSDYKSHITVINIKGNKLRQDILQTSRQDIIHPSHVCALRYWDFLSQFKVATAVRYNTIGIYDIRDGPYINKNINDVISSCPADRSVSCITTDAVNNHIIVGCDGSQNLYVFYRQLNYSHTLTLPDVISYPWDITVHDSHLIVCDKYGSKAYAVTMTGPECEVIYEFTKPDGERNACPLSVCTDRNGFIYMLWSVGHGRRIIVQYSQDGRQLLTTRQVDRNSLCITTVVTGEDEKLLIATYRTGKLFTYGLNEVK